MRLKFIEYIINAACCECRCGARRRLLVYYSLFWEIRNEKRANPELFAKGLLVSNVVASNNIKFGLQGSGSGHGWSRRGPTILQTRHEIFNGSELNHDGKVNFLISGDASLPAESVESAGKGNTELLISVIYLAASQTHPRTTPKYPADPFPQSRTLETSHLPLSRSSRLTLIQLKTSDDRAKQRRIDHENFNWCYRYERG